MYAEQARIKRASFNCSTRSDIRTFGATDDIERLSRRMEVHIQSTSSTTHHATNSFVVMGANLEMWMYAFKTSDGEKTKLKRKRPQRSAEDGKRESVPKSVFHPQLCYQRIDSRYNCTVDGKDNIRHLACEILLKTALLMRSKSDMTPPKKNWRLWSLTWVRRF